MMSLTILRDIPGTGKFYNHKQTLRNYQDLIMEHYIMNYNNEFLERYEGVVKINIICFYKGKPGAKPSIDTLTDVTIKALTNVAFESPQQISFIGVTKIPVNSIKEQQFQLHIEFERYASNS